MQSPHVVTRCSLACRGAVCQGVGSLQKELHGKVQALLAGEIQERSSQSRGLQVELCELRGQLEGEKKAREAHRAVDKQSAVSRSVFIGH